VGTWLNFEPARLGRHNMAGQRSMRAPQVDWHAALTDWAFRSSIFAEDQCEAIMSKVRNKEYQALLKESAKCSTKQIVPDAKEYISETIDDPEARQWPTPSRRFNTSGLISGRDSATTASNNEQSIKPVVVRIVFP
jgi:hypothetical protein